MLTIELDSFDFQLKKGSIENIGPANTEAAVKLFDVEDATVREFGDKRVKCVFEDGAENELQVALSPEQVRAIRGEIEDLEVESRVFD